MPSSDVNGIFALAGYLTLPFSENPAVGADVNVMGMINTLEAARLSGPRRVVFASSVAVYGGDVEGVVDESRAFRAADISPAAASYGASKLLGESLGRLYAQRYGVECCALRFSTVYGERQHARGINALYILEAMQAARAGRRVVVRGSGDEAHDYLYAGDAARACVRAMDSAGANGAFNIASGRSTSVNEIVAMVLEEYGSTLRAGARRRYANGAIDGAPRAAHLHGTGEGNPRLGADGAAARRYRPPPALAGRARCVARPWRLSNVRSVRL